MYVTCKNVIFSILPCFVEIVSTGSGLGLHTRRIGKGWTGAEDIEDLLLTVVRRPPPCLLSPVCKAWLQGGLQ